jgi:hypothetical protein
MRLNRFVALGALIAVTGGAATAYALSGAQRQSAPQPDHPAPAVSATLVQPDSAAMHAMHNRLVEIAEALKSGAMEVGDAATALHELMMQAAEHHGIHHPGMAGHEAHDSATHELHMQNKAMHEEHMENHGTAAPAHHGAPGAEMHKSKTTGGGSQ